MCCFWGSDFDPHQSLYCILAWLAAWVCRKTKAIDRFEREVKLAGRPKENVEWKQPKTPPTSPNTEYWHQKTLQAREYDAVRKENQKRTKGKKKESITVYTVRKEKKKRKTRQKEDKYVSLSALCSSVFSAPSRGRVCRQAANLLWSPFP